MQWYALLSAVAFVGVPFVVVAVAYYVIIALEDRL